VSASIRVVFVATAFCGLAASASAAEPAAVPRAPHPEFVLPESGASGQRAIDLLGEHLAAVAAAQGKTPEELRRLLLSDRTARIDRRGHLYFVDELEAPLPASGTVPSAPLPGR
jgi:hypothetical protein